MLGGAAQQKPATILIEDRLSKQHGFKGIVAFLKKTKNVSESNISAKCARTKGLRGILSGLFDRSTA